MTSVRRIGASRLARSAALVGAATLAANGLNAVFHFVMARVLEPGDYSLMATLFAVILIPGVPMLAVQTVVARDVAERLAAGDERGAGVAIRETFSALGRVAPPLVAVGLAVGVPVGYLLNVRQMLPLAGTAIAIGLSLALPILYGALQGSSRFGRYSAVQLVHVALKLVLCVGLGVLGTGVSGVMLGLAAAGGATVVLSLLPLRGYLSASRHARLEPRRMLSRYSWSSAAALTAFAAITQLDVAVARSSFDAGVAGAYAAATVAAKTLLIIPTAVTTVLFPHTATLDNRLRERRTLRAGVAAVALLGACATAVLAAFPGTTIDLLFGAGYEHGRFWIAPLALTMTLYGISAVYLFHFLALARSGYAFVTGGALLFQGLGYALFHDRPREVILVHGATAVLLVAASEIFERLDRRPTT